ncbi:MAG: phage tail protein [Clostridiales bacterium]|nr:phage tail protein [Clostridiales bacterium]
MIKVKRDGVEVFCGEVRECPKDKDKIRRVYAVGELTFLHNSIQPQIIYGEITPYVFLSRVLAAHNNQVEARQQFTIGQVTISNGFNPINFQTDHNETIDAIRTMLLDNLGGVLRVRKVGNTRYLDYITLAEYGAYNTQGITFGENLMDYAENYSANNVVTAIIPRGATIETENSDLTKHVDITSVNGGNDFLVNTSAVVNFGYIWRVVDFDGIESPAELKQAGQQYLSDNQYDDMELTVTAADLSQLDTSIDGFGLGDRVRVLAEPYGMDRVFPVKSITYYPQAPQNERIQLSANIRRKSTYTASAAAVASVTSAEAKKEDLTIKRIIMQEMSNIVAQFTGSAGGYKVTEFDSDGKWLRDLYMDAPDKAQATNIMQISMAGIAFSQNGYNGPYTSAWTLDGTFNADRILTGTLLASLIKVGILSDVRGNTTWNMETGELITKVLQLVSTYLTISTTGVITSRSLPNSQGVSEESLEIDRAVIRGKRYGTDVGYIDLSADTDSGDGAAEYDAVIGSNSALRFEFYRQIDIVDKYNNVLVGYFDGNGWHGPVDENFLPEPTVIYVDNGNNSGSGSGNNNNSNNGGS